MGLSQPWMRNYNYLSDYFYTLYRYYQEANRTYPISYYSIDRDNTIWDNIKIMGGAYEKAGVGELSGVVWKKIMMFPVFSSEQITPESNSDEKGLTLYDSLSSSIAFPASYGLKPMEGDAVDLNYAFAYDTPKINPIFVVTSVDSSHHGVYHQIYKCTLKIAPFDISEIEQQISSIYLFMESLTKIVDINKAKLLIKLEQKAGELSTRLNTSLFNNSTGFYLVNSGDL